MDHFTLTAIFLFVLFLLLGTGVWIGLALMGVAAIGIILFDKGFVGANLTDKAWDSSSSWTLTALPLFIWMGEILYRTRLSEDMFKGLAPWMARMPGGLLHTNVVGCTIFAAVSGSSAATLTTVGKMSIPELRRRGYPEFMTIGTLAGSATLGLMIPPSLTLIVYGVTINESITQLFMAGIFPGLGSGRHVHALRGRVVLPASVRAPSCRGRALLQGEALQLPLPDPRDLPRAAGDRVDVFRLRDSHRSRGVRRSRRADSCSHPGLAQLVNLLRESTWRHADIGDDRSHPHGRGFSEPVDGLHGIAARTGTVD